MSFAKAIRPHVTKELQRAAQAYRKGEPGLSFSHLERAHILGQPSTREHVRVHCQMLAWGVRQRQPREALGQIFRIFGAATKTAFGLVPVGNTGGSDISPFRPLPVPPDIQSLIEQARMEE